ncbi:hypothetical protein [Candidatus Methanocrinis natronophilus]|uniref:Uncharacterized protein n=1 Tax=Candidatus Methanocrinis natronophilus TaxID=3033396 RepID=A0ABT5X627_9EURY|nr:hypothetical protein [Candidatus Methanocrinis natronophilus]MDF0590141.1 hypothetical protein [Candidatus Methanocrinis natronophilus]
MAGDLAENLARSDPEERDRILRRCREMEDPLEVFRPLSNPERIWEIAGVEGDGYILVETDAVTFFPSMGSHNPGALDYAVAMNRRYFFRGLWFSIISLNCEYLRRTPDGTLAYTLEHEFEMGRLYQEAFGEMRKLSPGEKLQISQAAQKTSVDKTRISLADLIDEEMLMLQISGSQPAIPKPYAETALLAYLEDNFSKLEVFGSESRDDGEEAFGAELYAEFEGWSLFSRESYRLFVREVEEGVREAYRGYV